MIANGPQIKAFMSSEIKKDKHVITSNISLHCREGNLTWPRLGAGITEWIELVSGGS